MIGKEGKLAGQSKLDIQISKLLGQIKNILNNVKVKFSPKFIVDRMSKKGDYPHEVAENYNIDPNKKITTQDKEKDLANAYKNQPRESYLPDDVAAQINKDKDLQDQINKAQKDKHPENYKEEPNEKKEEGEPEEGAEKKEPEEIKEKPNEKPEEKGMEEPEGKSVEAGTEGATKAGKSAADLAKTGGGTAANAAGSAVGGASGAGAGAAAGAAAGGATAAGGSAAAGGGAAAAAATAGIWGPIGIAILVIIVIIVLFLIIGPLLKSLGKEGHIEAKAYENSGNYNVTLSLSKFENLKKALETNSDEFIKMIEKEKKNESQRQKPREEVIKLCNEIIAKTNELKNLSSAGKENADPAQKGKKEAIKVQILALTQQLVEKTSDLLSIALREIGVCRGTKEFSKKRFNNGSAWCAAFVRYIFSQAGITLPATDLAPDMYCAMKKDTNKYITFKAGEGTPQTGDIVFFYFSDQGIDKSFCNEEIVHVGIVKSYNGGNKITTIEGNTSSADGSSCVAEKSRDIQPNYGVSGARFFARVK